MTDPASSGYADVNGVHMYWESRGDGGTPLVVVHGGFGQASAFGDLLDRWAASRRVIAIDLQGHGHTRDIDRPFSFEVFGDDIAATIDALGIGPADLFGYSLGGSASLRAAIQHPGRIRRLALVSIPCRRDGWFPEVREGMSQVGSAGFEQMKQSALYATWAAVAPDPDAFPVLMDKTGALLRRPYDWSEEIPKLTMPVQLIYGDADSIPVSHVAEFYALLGGGLRDSGWDGSLRSANRLTVLAGRTHYNVCESPAMAGIVGHFTLG
ncbi:MAG TPA: alpha/beta hydrolase [Candidatus Dormibacteraeota bacterium]